MDSSSLLLLLLVLACVPLSFLLVLTFIVRPRPVKVPIKNRHVFISGGSSGIGLALARRVAAEGARVSILARSLPKLEEAREEIRLATGVDAAIFSVDVRNAAAVARAVEEAGPIDVLVCNHGVFPALELELQDLDDVRTVMDVNVMGTFHLIKAALPGMKRRTKETGLPASIGIMSSQSGLVGVYGFTAYSASKFALRGLAESLQHEVIADNIRVNLICPPATETPGFVEETKVRPEVVNMIAETGGVVMKADDVAKISLNGIKSGTFIVTFDFEGIILSIAGAGLSPQPSSLAAIVEVLGAGFMRFVALCFQWKWHNIIEKYHANKNKK